MRKLLFFSLFLSTVITAKAQSFEVGLSVGPSIYNGDISVTLQNFLPQTRLAVGAFGRYFFNSSIAARGNVYMGQIFADEKAYPASAYRGQRGFSFKTSYTEISAQGEWHILKMDRDFSFSFTEEDPFITLYGYAGPAFTFFNNTTDFNVPNPVKDDVSADRDAQYSKSALALMGGGGLRMQLNDRLAIGGEMGFRRSFSDYLDGISKLVGPRVKDYYFVGGVTVSWKFDGLSGGNGGYGRGRGGRRKGFGCPTF